MVVDVSRMAQVPKLERVTTQTVSTQTEAFISEEVSKSKEVSIQTETLMSNHQLEDIDKISEPEECPKTNNLFGAEKLDEHAGISKPEASSEPTKTTLDKNTPKHTEHNNQLEVISESTPTGSTVIPKKMTEQAEVQQSEKILTSVPMVEKDENISTWRRFKKVYDTSTSLPVQA